MNGISNHNLNHCGKMVLPIIFDRVVCVNIKYWNYNRFKHG